MELKIMTDFINYDTKCPIIESKLSDYVQEVSPNLFLFFNPFNQSFRNHKPIRNQSWSHHLNFKWVIFNQMGHFHISLSNLDNGTLVVDYQVLLETKALLQRLLLSFDDPIL